MGTLLSSEIIIFFPNSLKILRENYSLTIKDLSQKLNLDFNTVKSYEFHNDIPSYPVLIKFAQFFNVSLDYLIIGDLTPFVHNIKFLELAHKIDCFGINERYKIEASASTLLKNDLNPEIKLDPKLPALTPFFHTNLKLIRKSKELSQAQISKEIGITRVQVTRYEKKSYPRIKNLVRISQFLNTSIHSLLTGKKLFYDFNNAGLKDIILKADKVLSLEEIKFLIHLMQRIIEDSQE